MTTYYGTSGGTVYPSAYAAPAFVPYEPRDPTSRFAATFRALVDPRALEPGEHLRVVGSLAALTAWGDGVALAPHAADARVWEVTVVLPFARGEAAASGLFQFRYLIARNDGAAAPLEEGGALRVETGLRPCYYHVLQVSARV